MKTAIILLCVCICFPAAAGFAGNATNRFEGKLTPCPVEGMEQPALCGDLQVWENRAAKAGRKIPIHVAVLPAFSPDPAPDPVLFFEGGPGYPGTKSVKEIGDLLRDLRKDRDIIFYDQRGTGLSHSLACELPGHADNPQGYLIDLFPLEPLRACLPKLQEKADLRLYTSSIAMDDVDEIREWLGYERLNLFGISYGSRAAQVYLRQHGDHVRSVVLMGVVPMNDRMPLPFARFAQTSLDRVIDDCQDTPECRAAFPGLRKDLQKIFAELDRGPVRATFTNPDTEKPAQVEMNRSVFSAALRSMLYDADLYISVPLFIHQAAGGDYSLIARRAYEYGKEGDDWSRGMYLSITCAEDIPGIDMKDVPAAIAGTFLTDDRIRQQVNACAFWPRADLPAGFGEPVQSIAPVLLLSGWMDPVTPPEQATEVAQHLPNSLHLIARDAGHGPFGLENEACEWRILHDFIQDGSPFNVDTSCLRWMRHKPYLVK